MGWSKVRDLECEPRAIKQCALWSCGGTNGVEINIDGTIIKLPRKVIWDMIADDYVTRQIIKYEQMDSTDAILEIMKGGIETC